MLRNTGRSTICETRPTSDSPGHKAQHAPAIFEFLDRSLNIYFVELGSSAIRSFIQHETRQIGLCYKFTQIAIPLGLPGVAIQMP